jgi:hypothetical protein
MPVNTSIIDHFIFHERYQGFSSGFLREDLRLAEEEEGFFFSIFLGDK